MRNILLYLSRQPALRRWMETAPAARPLSARFVAGMSLDSALEAAQSVNAQHMTASLDHRWPHNGFTNRDKLGG